MTIKDQIESYTGVEITVAKQERYLSWLRSIQVSLSYLVTEKDAVHLLDTLNVPVEGIDVTDKRYLRPHKAGRVAGWYPGEAEQAIANNDYSGFYKVSALAPAAIINGGTLKVFPDGGHLTCYRPAPITVLTTEVVPSLPMPLSVASLAHTAVQGLIEEINQINRQKMKAISESAPADITATQASAGDIAIPTITSPTLQAGQEYTKENLSLDFTEAESRQSDDDIEMLQGQISILQKQIEEANTKMTDELNRVSTALSGYQSQVQHSLAQGELSLRGSSEQVSADLQASLANVQTSLQAAIQDRQSKVQHYQNELSKVGLNIQIDDSKIAGYTRSITNLQELFTQSVQAYLTGTQMEHFTPAPVNPNNE